MKNIILILILVIASSNLRGQQPYECGSDCIVYVTDSCVFSYPSTFSQCYNVGYNLWNGGDMTGAYIVVGTDTFYWVSDGTYSKPGTVSCDTSGAVSTSNFFFWFDNPEESILECFHGTFLPINLMNLKIDCHKNMNVVLWLTSSEQNSSHFEVERTTNGKDWIKIGQVAAKGYSYQMITYTFTDNKPSININYYRLKMVDLDGSVEYSNIVYGNCSSELGYGISISPNPMGSELTIESRIKLGDIELRSVDGKLIFKKYEEKNSLKIPTADLSPGVYFVKVKGERYKLVK